MNVYISYDCLSCFERQSLSTVTVTFKKQPKVFVLKNKKTKKLMPFDVWPQKNWLVKEGFTVVEHVDVCSGGQNS